MSDPIKTYREHNKKIFARDKKFDIKDIEFALSNDNTIQKTSEKSTIYNLIEDGISILDTNLNVLNVNTTLRSWYPGRQSFVGKKCFYVFHDRKEPCEICPVMKSLIDGVAHCDIISYYKKSNGATGWHELQSFPVMDGDQLVGIAEYVKDITREVNLYSRIFDIENRMHGFKEQNEILKLYLEQVKSEKFDISTNINNNIKKFVKPLIKQFKDNCSEKNLEYDLISLIDTLFDNIVTPFLEESISQENFTSREIQIMSMIKSGKSSKEIADEMNLSTKTVDFHRANVRKKLGLEKTDNLRACLLRSPQGLD